MCDKSHSCTNCDGCNNKTKPKDCQNNGCGRCCGGNCDGKKTNSFLLILLEKQFLPFLYSDEIIIFKENYDTNLSEILEFANIIKECEMLEYLTLDYDIELDEFSYLDYENISNLQEYKNISFKKGTIAITKKCIDVFMNK